MSKIHNTTIKGGRSPEENLNGRKAHGHFNRLPYRPVRCEFSALHLLILHCSAYAVHLYGVSCILFLARVLSSGKSWLQL